MTETVGQRIKTIHLEREKSAGRAPLSDKALAKLLGVSYESLRKWSAGKTAPNRKRAAHIAAVLECQVEQFMHGVKFGADEPAPVLLADIEAELLAAFRALSPNSPAREKVLAFAQGAAAADPSASEALPPQVVNFMAAKKERHLAQKSPAGPIRAPRPAPAPRHGKHDATDPPKQP